ncbi:MAG: GDP-mannose mannosyl hydrolase [Planctomycetota bacterium]|nr:GDP-mannose mannosyl hydrolase [Planctomycetota bacterium]
MKLDDSKFIQIVDSAPLVSIDLVIRNAEGAILLGKRVNRPAAGYWFVPGGRVRKNELVLSAVRRVAESELGLRLVMEEVRFMGVYEHFYDDNYLGREGVGTHYVVLAYEYLLQDSKPLRKDDQHSELRWWKVNDLLNCSDVHKNTKAYFKQI